MNSSQRALVKYWLQIGKVRRERSNPNDPASAFRYYFRWRRHPNHPRIIEFALQDSWKSFFQMWDLFTYQCFEIYEETGDLHIYDPWHHDAFVGMSVRLGVFGKGTQIYQCLEVLK